MGPSKPFFYGNVAYLHTLTQDPHSDVYVTGMEGTRAVPDSSSSTLGAKYAVFYGNVEMSHTLTRSSQRRLRYRHGRYARSS